MRAPLVATLGAALVGVTAPASAAAQPDLPDVRSCAVEFLDWQVIGGFYVEFGPGGEVVVRWDRVNGTVTFVVGKTTGLVTCLTA